MSLLRTAARKMLWQSGAYRALSRIRPWGGVVVVAYHGVRRAARTIAHTSEELHVRQCVLEEQLRVLRTLGTPISLDRWREARRGGRPLPVRAVLVTFDDGYRSLRRVALPLLERHDIPAVAFICTGPGPLNELLWYDALERRRSMSAVEDAKRLPYDKWLSLIEEYRTTAEPDDERALMTEEDVADIADHPLVEIGAHTVNHPILARATAAVQHQEIAQSVSTLEQWTGRRIRAFAYPNGQPGVDFNADTVSIVQTLGLEHAFSTEARVAAADDPMEACPRFTMLDSIGESQLAQNLAVAWQPRV